MQTVVEYLERFYFTERELEKPSRAFILMKLGIFGAFLKRSPTLGDLTSELINQFILHRLESRSRETVRGERSTLRAIWNDAHERGVLPNPPSRIRKIKKLLPPPVAWDEGQLRRLLIEAARQRGLLRGKGISRATYWRMFFLIAYQSALRLGDLERISSSLITGPGSYTIMQHKTKKPLRFTIDQTAWDAIVATNPSKRKYLLRVLSRPAFFDALKIITGNCDLTGGTKMIRKGAGSAFEREHPGEGHKLLGNGRDVFLQYYADPRITDIPGRLPPKLDTA